MNMKTLFFLAFSWLTYSLAAEHSIVFVHVGPQLPKYMHDALAQARLFNKSCDIFLLGNKRALRGFVEAEQLNIKLIAVESLKKTATHESFISQSTLDRVFRDGFWFYASERFLYLDDFMQQYDVRNVYHLENDVMLYCDLSELESIFVVHYPGIAATFDNDDRCIPGFVYIANKNIMHELADFFVANAQRDKSDMEILTLFKRHSCEGKINNLPIIMDSYRENFPLKNPLGQTTRYPEAYSKNINLFNSVFDAAAIGQYLGGIDPRNAGAYNVKSSTIDPRSSEEGPGFINERCLFNPSKLTFTWKNDSEGRKVPYMVFGSESYRINNLHIHCKNLKEFSSI